MVVPELRAVIVNIDEKNKKLKYFFYFDGKVTDELYDLASCVSCESSASFPIDYFPEEGKFLKWKYPKKIPEDKGILAYLRYENG